MTTRLTSKKVADYLVDKLNKREEEYKRVMNIAPDGSDALCERKIDEERDYLDYKVKNQDEYRYVKLGQLEDIEEELGIDFLLLDKICQKGVYCYKKSIKDFDSISKRLGDIIHIQNSDIHIDFFGCYKEKRMGVSIMGCIDFVYHSLPIKDYGITWALTKEELE